MRYVFYGYTALALASGILWGLGRPPLSRSGSIALLVGYVVFIALAVVLPRLRVFTRAVSRGPRNARGVALTFDDGPHPIYTRRVLAVLERYGAHATFFVVGRKAAAHPDVVREIVARGHAIGSHSFDHSRAYTFRSVRALHDDMDACDRVIEEIVGHAPRLYRPPFGLVNPRIGRMIDERDLVHVHWSVKGIDGIARATADGVARRVIPSLRDGAIVLLHDAAERDDRAPIAADALPAILDAMRAQNLDAVTVGELLGQDASAANRPSGIAEGRS